MLETEILFVKDISKMFRISSNTLRRRLWRERTGIPLRKVGRQLCGTKTEIDKWFRGLNG